MIAAAVSEIQALHAPSTLQIEPYWHNRGDIAKRLGREPARLFMEGSEDAKLLVVS